MRHVLEIIKSMNKRQQRHRHTRLDRVSALITIEQFPTFVGMTLQRVYISGIIQNFSNHF